MSTEQPRAAPLETETEPVAIFNAASRRRRWVPPYLTALCLIAAAIALFIVSLFILYATPVVQVSSAGSFFGIPDYDLLFPGNETAKIWAANATCQALLNEGCRLLFPNAASTSAMLNKLFADTDPLFGTVDDDMLSEASPYEMLSCDWHAGVVQGTQVPPWALYPRVMVDIEMRSTTLPDMVNVSMSVGCLAQAVPALALTTVRIEQSAMATLVDDVAALQSGEIVEAPSLDALTTHGTRESLEIVNAMHEEQKSCAQFINGKCTTITGTDAPIYLMANGEMRACSWSSDPSATVTVEVCQDATVQRPLGNPRSTFSTRTDMEFRYRAFPRDVQLVRLDGSPNTVSAVTGRPTTRFTRPGLSRTMGVTIVGLAVLGVGLLLTIFAIVVISCYNRRTTRSSAALREGMRGPGTSAIGRLVGPRGELLRHVADSGDAADDEPLFEYERPAHQREDNLSQEASPYGAGTYYGLGDHTPPSSPAAVTTATGQAPSPRGDGTYSDHTPYGSANEAVWNAEGEDMQVTGARGFHDVKAVTVTNSSDAVVADDSPSSLASPAAAQGDAATTAAARATSSSGIPLRIEGSSRVYAQVGIPTLSRYVQHASRMMITTTVISVVLTIGAVLALVIVIANGIGSMEHWRRNSYPVWADTVATLDMHPEAGAVVVRAIATVCVVASAVIMFCVLLLRVH